MKRLLIAVMTACIALTACGGGGSEDDPDSPKPTVSIPAMPLCQSTPTGHTAACK